MAAAGVRRVEVLCFPPWALAPWCGYAILIIFGVVLLLPAVWNLAQSSAGLLRAEDPIGPLIGAVVYGTLGLFALGSARMLRRNAEASRPAAAARPVETPTPAPVAPANVDAQLRGLAKLREQGILNADEFAAAEGRVARHSRQTR